MNSYRWILIVICLAGLSVAACGGPEPAVEEQAAQAPVEPIPAPAPPVASEPAVDPLEQSLIGELQDVDLIASTLTITDMEGNEQSFLFSESTEIVGVSDIQGLTGQQGDQVLVRYSEQDGYRVADWIEILPR